VRGKRLWRVGRDSHRGTKFLENISTYKWDRAEWDDEERLCKYYTSSRARKKQSFVWVVGRAVNSHNRDR
jgi:hypothetical protein